MICKNCGKENIAGAKFCENCGSALEELQENVVSSENVQNDTNLVNNTVAEQLGFENTTPAPENTVTPTGPEVTEAPNNTVEPNAPGVEQSELNPVQPPMPPIPPATPAQSSKKESSKSGIFIIIGVVLALVAVLLVFVAFNKSNSSKNSVEVLEKAIANIEQKGKNSGTIEVSVTVQSSGVDVNLTGSVKYQKTSDKYNVEVALNKSAMFDEMKAYITGDKESVNAYVKTSLINSFLGIDGEDKWLHSTLELSELDIDFEEIEKETEKIDLSDLGLDKKLKYIDKDAGVNHYQLTVDEELIKKIVEKVSKEEEELESYDIDSIDFDDSFVIDIYVNDYNELQKISVDLTKLINSEDITKALFTIEFKNLNSTVVSIPEEALKSEQKIEEYLAQAYETGEANFDLGDE